MLLLEMLLLLLLLLVMLMLMLPQSKQQQTVKQSEMFYLWALHGRGVECHMRCSNKTNNEAVTCFAIAFAFPIAFIYFTITITTTGTLILVLVPCCRGARCRYLCLSTARQMNNFNKCKTLPLPETVMT